MAELNVEKLKFLRKREAVSTAFIVCAAVILVSAITCYSVAGALSVNILKTVSLAAGVPLLTLSVAFAAFFNLKYSPQAEKIIGEFIVDVIAENVQTLHVEKESLTYLISIDVDKIFVNVNNFKESLNFDFSPLKKLSAGKKLFAVAYLENTLCSFFCRLVAKGNAFKEVSFVEKNNARQKTGKPFYIVKDGLIERKALKRHLKSRAEIKKRNK